MLPALLPLPLAAVGEMECEAGAPSGPLSAPHPCGVLWEVGSAVAELSRSDYHPPAWTPEMQYISTFFIYGIEGALSLTKTVEKH